MPMSLLVRIAAAAVLALSATSVSACDLCSVYTAQLAHGQGSSGWYTGIATQYTRYDELREGSDTIADPADQYLNGSVTQLLLGYGINREWTVQANLPYIDRNFRRVEHEGVERGSETGIGDASITAQYLAYRHDTEDSSFVWRVLGGIKFGTGDSDRLREELEEDHEHPAQAKHDDETPSGVHGHDLTLGSGSTDFLIGSSISGRNDRWLYLGELQYAIRREGDFDYRVGNDLHWHLGAGRYLQLEHQRSTALMLTLSGETKRYDELAGERLDDTHQRAVFLGPQLQATFGTRYALDLQVEFPLDQHVSEIQITPGWRARAALVVRFD